MKKFNLIATDIISFYLSLQIVIIFRYGMDNASEMFELHLLPFSLLLFAWLLIYFITNLYDIDYLRNDYVFYSRFFKAITASFGVSVIFFYLLPIFSITPKANLLLFTVAFTIINFLLRALYNRVISSSALSNNTLIIGLNQKTLDLIDFTKNNPQVGYKITHVFVLKDEDIENVSIDQSVKLIKNTNELIEILLKGEVRIIPISTDAYKTQKIVNLLYAFLAKGIQYHALTDFYESVVGKIPLQAIDQTWFLINFTEGTKKNYEILKRILDITFAIIGSIPVLVLAPFISALIRIDSKGPIFYKQKRVGRFGNTYDMFKFRTMVQDAEKKGAVWAKKDDPRVTHVGKYLRKSRLDELPQIWNILKGDMSFTGPRSERPEFHEELNNSIPFYEERYLVKPGLTGWAQIRFKYTASKEDSSSKLQYDLFYIKHRSLGLDLSIILKTIYGVIAGAGL